MADMGRSSLTLRPSSLKLRSPSSASRLDEWSSLNLFFFASSSATWRRPGLPFIPISVLYFQFVDCLPARSVQFLIENEIEFHFHNQGLNPMFSALVVTLREGVEAALIVGITLVYLAKIGRADLRRTVYYALVAALFGSIAGAVALSYAPINQDKVEGWVMLVAAVFVVSMVIFMMRTARKLKGEIESKVGSLATDGGSKWGLFAFVFLMVFREGIETVAILAGVSLNSTELMSFLGTLLGVALAVVFGVMFVKGSVRIDLRKFFKVTTVILFLWQRS